MKEARDRNRVTPEGKMLGAQMARLAEKSIAALALEGEPDERCKSCAFRAGTVPNGCPQTQLDVIKSVIEGTPFDCHQHDRKGWPCHGWYAARVEIRRAERARGVPLPVTECPWEFSPPDDDDSGHEAQPTDSAQPAICEPSQKEAQPDEQESGSAGAAGEST